MADEMRIRIWDVEHGQCAMVQHVQRAGIADQGGRIAMIDSGSKDDWRPSTYLKETLGRNRLDYLIVTNADQDHMSDLQGLWDAGISVHTFYRNKSYTGSAIKAIKQATGGRTHRRC
jgi:beta-lactamase superfamily II metal-dependent hydrolase